ncbi:secretion/DNA translocation related TadE-like protein [Georgenia soli]|uniref:Secretion/DNA translocation related TadE-like protein n=1 Tax=Georgenia soli TaxID=638953 RepID=A0A2A9EJU5_9MICO|nr:Rv3654c family TadE-like protein [Georgenia soli]PFG39234.1 secretion/DNA translocation related TadE-like protein [Georgenia soli]
MRCPSGGRPPRGCAAGPGGPDRGAGSVLGLALVAVLLTLTLAVVGVSRAVHARGTAQVAADLGALAAAQARHDPAGVSRDPCAVAAEVVAANGAEIVRCREVGGDVVVSTRVPLSDGTGLAARAVARAGPAD